MIANFHIPWLSGPLAAALLVMGCASHKGDVTEPGKEAAVFRPTLQKQREQELQQAWRNQPYETLIAAYGQPAVTMDVPGPRILKTSVFVYGVRDRRSDCVDAFTIVVHGQSREVTVADYFCR